MDDGIAFSPGAIAALAAIWVVIQGAIVTLFLLLIRSKNDQIKAAEAREAEWKRLAVRGANEIIPSLATELRVQVRDHHRELREPLEP